MKSAEPEGTWVLAALTEVYGGTSAIITHLNHQKVLCALTAGCVNTGDEGQPHPSEKAGPCEAWRAVDLVTSQLSGPCEMTFAVGLGELRRWKAERDWGARGSGGLAQAEHRNGRRDSSPRCSPCREASCAVTQGCFSSTGTAMKWPATVVFHKISGCSLCGLRYNDCNDAGAMEIQFQLIQEGNNLHQCLRLPILLLPKPRV